ncbi:16S rRNA (cytidine(1402)-2'-O)-methyltransferase [bacterium]|nr:MAG: 16S rRNA (cytidine(1402)-2'-O)-methyltransferase [bacterium]
MPTGKLILVPTPIGNLEDITCRAVRILEEVDAIAAEDTRSAQILLKRYEIKKPVLSFHVKNEWGRAEEIIRRVRDGENIAVISESGTPAISDPGYTLVRKAIETGIELEVLPGPTAFVPALVMSGFPVNGFSFEGFLPHSGKGRRRRLRQLAEEKPRTLVFYVSPHRITDFIQDAVSILGDREAVLCRELTKIHEEIIRGKLSQIAGNISEIKGELILVIGTE